MINPNNIAIDNTNFIFETNFAGDPRKDTYGDSRRKANVLIPDPEQAADLIKAGFKVKQTRPRKNEDPEYFKPEYYVQVILKYRKIDQTPVKYPPKVYLVTENNEVLMDEDTVGELDSIRVQNVNVVLNERIYDRENNGKTLYVRTMYVEQDLTDDPYAQIYRERRLAAQRAAGDMESPF